MSPARDLGGESPTSRELWASLAFEHDPAGARSPSSSRARSSTAKARTVAGRRGNAAVSWSRTAVVGHSARTCGSPRRASRPRQRPRQRTGRSTPGSGAFPNSWRCRAAVRVRAPVPWWTGNHLSSMHRQRVSNDDQRPVAVRPGGGGAMSIPGSRSRYRVSPEASESIAVRSLRQMCSRIRSRASSTSTNFQLPISRSRTSIAATPSADSTQPSNTNTTWSSHGPSGDRRKYPSEASWSLEPDEPRAMSSAGSGSPTP
jgi:hypothetical protein